MKFNPAKIKYTEITPKSPIKHIRDPIGFLIIITIAPKNNASTLINSNDSLLNPLKRRS
jgi:hypothetical protein